MHAKLHNPNYVYQVLVLKKQNFILGGFFHLIFIVLHDNLLKNIGDEFLKFD